MKITTVCAFFIFSLAILTGSPGLYAAEEVEEAYSEDDASGSDPSAFEGDSDSMPGERAPENLPMEDAPVDAGIGVE